MSITQQWHTQNRPFLKACAIILIPPVHSLRPKTPPAQMVPLRPGF